MPVPCQADLHSSSGTVHDSTLLALCRLGVDFLGPFPKVVGGYHFLYVAIDKFTKWLEATAMTTINKASTVKFLKSIVCHFGIPNRGITKNGTQLKCKMFQEFYDNININICYASVAHPWRNGQVERANIEILKGLKTRSYDCLRKCGMGWVDELPVVLWSNPTTTNRGTTETPFFLVYRAQAVLPLEVAKGSPMVVIYDEAVQDQVQHDDLDLLEEKRCHTNVRVTPYHQALKRYH
jgi:hypothetical protein